MTRGQETRATRPVFGTGCNLNAGTQPRYWINFNTARAPTTPIR